MFTINVDHTLAPVQILVLALARLRADNAMCTIVSTIDISSAHLRIYMS